ncbi:MAG: FHA domain-containing protein [Nitrospira sp.]
MIKHLHQFVDDAGRLSWGEFLIQHEHHVLVFIPIESTNSEPFYTAEHATDEAASRPPIDDSYRVGLLKKRTGAHPFENFITVGRAPTNDIVLKDIEVSKVHAFFEKVDGVWTVRDNASTNGTYHNGSRIGPGSKVLLRSSDTLKIGPGLSAVFFSTNDFYQFLRSPEVQEAFK